MKMLGRLIGEHVELDVIPGHSLGAVYADRAQVEQVIINLCVNARDAVSEGGRVTIETENVSLDAHQCTLIPESRPGEFVRLTVRDTGVGMDDEILQHLFEPFFTTKDQGQGTGLGLPVVYGVAAQHEGWIDVHSEPLVPWIST